MGEQGADGDQGAAEHQARLDHVGPDHRLDPAHRGVEAGDHGEGDDRHQVGADGGDALVAEPRRRARDEEAVGQHHEQRGNEEPRAGGERAHEEEEGRDVGLRPRAEAHPEVVVDGVDLERVVGLEEDVADHHAAEDQADDDLHVGEAAGRVALAGHAEEGGRAGLRRDDRGHHRPPRHAAAREREVAQAPVAAPEIKADGGDHREVGADDATVDQQVGVAHRPGHGPLSRTRHREPPICGGHACRRSRRRSMIGNRDHEMTRLSDRRRGVGR